MVRVAGIVAEFNPFHNGHEALAAASRGAGFSHIIAVMSGNFVQRAAAAVTDKRVRTRAALHCGVDLVIELPLPFATATAQRFAKGAAGLLYAAGCVDALCFGSECGDIDMLRRLAGLVDSPPVISLMKEHLREGMTFAKARTLAVRELYGENAAEQLSRPNNLLAVEYLRACGELGWKAGAFTFKRIGVEHDSETASERFASASYLRGYSGDMALIRRYVPEKAAAVYAKAMWDGFFPANMAKLDTAVLSALRRLGPEELAGLPELSEGIERRLYAAIRKSASLTELEQAVKTRRYTMARVRRLILCAFLGITASDLEMRPPYLRILGFNERGRELLAAMKDSALLPVSQSLARLRELNPVCARFADLESRATDQFGLTLPKPPGCGYEYTASGIFIRSHE